MIHPRYLIVLLISTATSWANTIFPIVDMCANIVTYILLETPHFFATRVRTTILLLSPHARNSPDIMSTKRTLLVIVRCIVRYKKNWLSIFSVQLIYGNFTARVPAAIRDHWNLRYAGNSLILFRGESSK